MKNIAIITARSGSKGLKDKNIKLLGEKPLLAYSIEAALQSEMFETVMVSTDSEQYAAIAKEYGAEVPFLRSEENSNDTAGSWDVIVEVLERYEKMGYKYDTVCLLQPTSPLRVSEDIVSAYAFYVEKEAEAISGVCPCEHPVQYMMTLDETKSLAEYRKSEPALPRQMLPTYYRENGAMYIRKIEYTEQDVKLIYDKEYAFVMDIKSSVDIDTIDDFEYAEFLLSKRGSSR